MLAEGIVKKTVFNVINYYIEYCLDSQLIQFINECDTGMDYSKTERVFGSEIANQFFDTIAVSNEIETKKYQEILCDIGYGFNSFDAYDISDDKMDVLIKNNVIEMNAEGLEYIRNYYNSHIIAYINPKTHIEPFVLRKNPV